MEIIKWIYYQTDNFKKIVTNSLNLLSSRINRELYAKKINKIIYSTTKKLLTLYAKIG